MINSRKAAKEASGNGAIEHDSNKLPLGISLKPASDIHAVVCGQMNDDEWNFGPLLAICYWLCSVMRVA